MKPFDEKFAENVRDVFDNYQEVVDMAALEALQQRMSRKRKLRIFALPPYASWAAAAALLILVSGILWLNVFNPRPMLTESSNEHQTREITTADTNEIAGKDLTDNSETISSETRSDSRSLSGISSRSISSVDTPAEKITVTDIPVITLVDSSVILQKPEADTIIPSVSQSAQEVLAEKPLENDLKKDSVIVRPNNLFIGNGNTTIASLHLDDPWPDEKKHNQNSSLQVVAGSMVSFTHNQVAEGMGYSAGVINEWKVSDVISLSTGGILTYNQFAYDPRGGGNSRLEMDYVNILPGEDRTSSNIETPINYNYSNEYEFMAIDIPLNAKFRLNHSNKNQLYFSAGFSSLVYLQEQFKESGMSYVESKFLDSQSGQYSNFTYATSITENETVNAFRRFDFARLLNLSFGYAIKREKDAIIIEPFLKYPLGSITSRDIQMGMGGITLKYSFNPW